MKPYPKSIKEQIKKIWQRNKLNLLFSILLFLILWDMSEGIRLSHFIALALLLTVIILKMPKEKPSITVEELLRRRK